MHDPARDKLGFTFEDMGEQAVKNIARPIHAYRIRFEGIELPQAILLRTTEVIE